MVLVTWPAAAGRRDAGCSVEEASGASGLGVGDGQRLDRLVGVEPARVGHDPQSGALDGLGLLARDSWTGQDRETVERDSRRDRWFSAEDALAYGFVDQVISSVDHVTPARSRAVGLAGAR